MRREEGEDFKARSPSWGKEWLTQRNEWRWAEAQWHEALGAGEGFWSSFER